MQGFLQMLCLPIFTPAFVNVQGRQESSEPSSVHSKLFGLRFRKPGSTVFTDSSQTVKLLGFPDAF